MSRDFAAALGYADYRNLEDVIERAKVACKKKGQIVEDRFGEATDMIPVGKGVKQPAQTILMSLWICFLAIQNADPRYEIVAFG